MTRAWTSDTRAPATETLALFAVAIYLLRKRPPWTLVVPVAAVAIWFAGISAGEAWLGWTA